MKNLAASAVLSKHRAEGIATLQQENAALKNEAAELTSSVQSMLEAMSKAEAAVRMACDIKDKGDAENQELTAQLATLKEKSATVEAERLAASLKVDLLKTKTDLAQTKTDLARMEADMEAEGDAAIKWEHDAKAAQNELINSEARAKASDDKAKGLESTLQEQYVSRSRLESTLQESEVCRSRLLKQLAEGGASQAKQQTDAALAESEKKVVALEQTTQDLQTQVKGASKRLKDAKAEAVQAQSVAQDCLHQLETERAAGRVLALSKAKEELAAEKQHGAHWQAALASLQQRAETAEAARKKADARVSLASSVQEKTDALMKQLRDTKAKEVAELRANVEQAEDGIAAQRTKGLKVHDLAKAMHENVFDIFTMIVEKHVPPDHALQLKAHIKAYGEETLREMQTAMADEMPINVDSPNDE
jgi:hypothetical protein